MLNKINPMAALNAGLCVAGGARASSRAESAGNMRSLSGLTTVVWNCSRRRDSHSGVTQWGRGGSGGVGSRAPRKTGSFELAEGSCQGAAQIILGVGMAARKTRAAELEDSLHLRARHAAAQQLLGDPLISNTPVGLGKPLRNPQPVQASLIGGRGCRGNQSSHRLPPCHLP